MHVVSQSNFLFFFGHAPFLSMLFFLNSPFSGALSFDGESFLVSRNPLVPGKEGFSIFVATSVGVVDGNPHSIVSWGNPYDRGTYFAYGVDLAP
jgi:hypothetical protein